MSKPLRILIVEDSEPDTQLLLHELKRANYNPTFERVATAASMSAALDRRRWDVVVADNSLPKFSALAALDLLRKRGSDLPFLIVSGTIGEELAVTAMKSGAQDYIMKGNLARLVPAVERELRETVERQQRRRAEEQLRATQEQFRVAQEIQQRLFPKLSPESDRFEIAGATYPVEATGGDYFDYMPLADGSLGVVVADVTGHGLGPALLMAETRAYLRAMAMNATDVGEILTRTNRALAEDVDLERFVTLIFAKFDPWSQSLVYSSAGHLTSYVLNDSGEIKAWLKRTGPPFGAPPRAPYAAAPAVPLAERDIVVLLTDGVEEAAGPDDDFFGVGRILEVVRGHTKNTAREILEALYRTVRDFGHNQPPLDDWTAVVIKVNPPSRQIARQETN